MGKLKKEIKKKKKSREKKHVIRNEARCRRGLRHLLRFAQSRSQLLPLLVWVSALLNVLASDQERRGQSMSQLSRVVRRRTVQILATHPRARSKAEGVEGARGQGGQIVGWRRCGQTQAT